MIPKRPPTTALALLLLTLLGLQPGGVDAQTQGSRTLVLALPDAFPAADAASILVRTTDQDIVVLRDDDLSVDALMMALSLLRRIGAEEPSPELGQVIPITGYSVLAPGSDARRARLEHALFRLERAEPTELGDLGPGRWVRLAG